MTLACIIRLMPATPIADNRPPIVVGIKQTNNATKTTMDIGSPLPEDSTANCEKGNKVTHTSKNISVSATNKMVSAISFGVLVRLAPSTKAIIRSKNPCPGAWVIRIINQSDNTFVPPVTALKSPPLSRITGADSPVIADSSTEAKPSMTSPSAGMISPTLTRTISSCLSSVA